VGSALAEVSIRLDEHIALPETWQYSAATATGLLSVLVGAMVGLIGFVVTVTVPVVQQATGTLSPRYMRLWYGDPFQKIVLATFAGTLTFSFSLLRRVTDTAVPDIGVTAAGALVTMNVLLLLAYVARFAHALRPVAVAAEAADAGRASSIDARLRTGNAPGHRWARPAGPGAKARMHGGSAALRRRLRTYRSGPGPDPRAGPPRRPAQAAADVRPGP